MADYPGAVSTGAVGRPLPLVTYLNTININGRYTDAGRATMLTIINEYKVTN